MNNKMSWFVDAYNNNKLEFTLFNTSYKKGTAVLPTGAGKSGKVYEDIVKHIEISNGEKIIFNLSAPILKLEAQFLNDLISVLKEIFKTKISNEEFMFFINSSADGNDYDIEHMNADVLRFNEIDKFRKSKTAKYAIVASCHKSLPKVAEKIDYLKKFATVINYLDEAHLVANETRDDKKRSELSKEGQERWDSVVELCKSEYLYALTATPDKGITDIINKAVSKDIKTDFHIFDVPARELIKANIILPVKTWINRVGDDDSEKITPEICTKFMKQVKNDSPKINHKILVTCSNTEHLRELKKELSKLGYKVFSTCARDGGLLNDENAEEEIDEVNFIKEIDEFNGECFVLHIKQLTQGIDVKTLTDCIIYNTTRLNDGVKRTLIQTIGRTIRPMAGERGMSEEKRLKKYGNVLLLIGDKDFDTVRRQTEAFLLKYYGRDGYKSFSHDISRDYGGTGKIKIKVGGENGFGDDYRDDLSILIETLKIDMEKYVTGTVVPRYKAFIKIGGGKPNPNLRPEEMDRFKEKFSHYQGEYETNELLSDTEFMKEVSDLFNKYDIE